MGNETVYTGTPIELCSQGLTETRPDWMREMDEEEQQETVERVEAILDSVLRALAGVVGKQIQSRERTALLGDIFDITTTEDAEVLARYRRACGNRVWLASPEIIDRAGRARERIRMALKIYHELRGQQEPDAVTPLDAPHTLRFADTGSQKRT